MPVALMLAFSGIQGLIDKGTKEGPLIFEEFRYVSTPQDFGIQAFPFQNFISNNPTDGTDIPYATCLDKTNFTTCSNFIQSSLLFNKVSPNQLKYYYTELAIVC